MITATLSCQTHLRRCSTAMKQPLTNDCAALLWRNIPPQQKLPAAFYRWTNAVVLSLGAAPLPFIESSSFAAGDPPLRPSESLLPILRPLPHSLIVPVGQVCGCRHGAGFRSLIPVGSPGRRIPSSVAYPSGCPFSRRLVLAASASGGYGLSFVGLPLSGRRGRAAAIGEPEFRICTESALRCS